MDDKRYDEQKRARAGTKATLRAVVALYFIFIGYKVITNKETTMSPVTAYLLGGVFIAAAFGFGVYTFISWRKDVEAAVIDEASDPSNDPAEVDDDDSE